jgi:hypothetical protein
MLRDPLTSRYRIAERRLCLLRQRHRYRPSLVCTAATITAQATSVTASDACSTSQGLGTAIFCACMYGTSIDNPDQCLNWLTLCLDLQDGPPSCSSDQVLNPGSDVNWIDSGNGECWADSACQWQQQNWMWSCCNCPSGFISITGGVCPAGDPTPGPPTLACVGCRSGEVLAGDATNGYYCIVSIQT